jgi:hypothetical protein
MTLTAIVADQSNVLKSTAVNVNVWPSTVNDALSPGSSPCRTLPSTLYCVVPSGHGMFPLLSARATTGAHNASPANANEENKRTNRARRGPLPYDMRSSLTPCRRDPHALGSAT